MAAALASLDQLELAWRTLTPDERPRATFKIEQASRYVRRAFPDLDARILAGTLSADDAADVVLAMVERALTMRANVQSQTEVRGPFSETIRYSGTDAGLYLTDAERASLAPAGVSVGRRAFAVDL